MVGGIGAERVAVLLDVRSGLLVLAALNLVSSVAVLRVGAPAHAAEQSIARESGVRVLRESAYLKSLALLVCLVAVSATLLDYALKAEAQAHISHGHNLMRFFAAFYTATALATFVVQSTMGRRALSRLGLSGTVGLLPAAVVIFGSLAATVGQLAVIAVAKGVDTVLSNSLFRSGYELFYTPIAPQKKRPTKALVDVGAERIGDAIGGGITLAVLAVTTVWAPNVVIVIAITASLAAVWLARRLGAGYVAELAASLKSGAVRLEDSEVLDATTRKTLTETTMALDRERLLEEIRALRTSQGLTDPPPKLDSEPALERERPHASNDEILLAFEDLLSDDAKRIRARLRTAPDPRWTPLLVPMLARADVRADVEDVLSALAPRVVGQLADTMLDSAQPFVVRRRIPRVLVNARSERAGEALLAALADDCFEVRYQAGRALARLTEGDSTLKFEAPRVFAAALRELDVDRKVWETQHLLEEDGDDSSPWLDGVLRVRLHRSVEHVFTLLSLVLDRDTLTLTLRALESDDAALRGTALEYLENVLPADVRKKLWPYLGQKSPRHAELRPREQIVEDLLRSMDSIGIDREALRRRTPHTS